MEVNPNVGEYEGSYREYRRRADRKVLALDGLNCRRPMLHKVDVSPSLNSYDDPFAYVFCDNYFIIDIR